MAEDEPESLFEKLEDDLREEAQSARESWLKWSALLSVLFSVFAALAGLEASFYANDAMIKQIQASDQWSYYQAKGIKGNLAEMETTILQQLNKPTVESEKQVQKYREEQAAIKKKSEGLSEESRHNLEKHEIFARAVTLLQIAIGIIGIAVLTKRRVFVLAALAMGIVALGILAEGLWMT